MRYETQPSDRCSRATGLEHAEISRRAAIQVGSVGLLGLGMNHVAGLRALANPTASSESESNSKSPKSVIYIFLSVEIG